MKIPFNIKYRPQIESGEYKVETKVGKPVRIVCWDRHCIFPILGLIEYGDEESSARYNSDGLYGGQADNPNNLFIVIPEAELTELEKAIKRGMLCAGLKGVSTTIIKETAKEVKDIICKGCTIGLEQYWKGREDVRKEAEKSYTFRYDTYQPPCFHGGVCTNPMRDCINCPMHSSGATTNTTSGTCKKD